MSEDRDAVEALGSLQRFPAWMWGNTEAVEFIEWLRAYNDDLPARASKVGFYGFDLYSLSASRKAVIEYLKKTDRKAADRTRAGHPKLERSIGVIYHSETSDIERSSHYFNTRLSKQFDAVIFLDETRAVEAIESTGSELHEVPETYPFGV